jgi:hypothetical protein
MNRSKRYIGRIVATALFWLGCLSIASAAVITYRFDGFSDGTRLTNQYGGLSFINATVLKSGFSLNEFAFPPHSADGAVFDDGGPIDIRFSTNVQSVSGYFTYLEGLTLSAYDSNDHLLAVASAAYFANLADGAGDPGSTANEQISVTSAGDLISRVVIRSSDEGGSLVLDDLTITSSVTDVPEPGTLLLMLSGLAIVWRRQYRWC